MAAPTVVTISHNLGRDEAKRRIASRIGDIGAHIPGGVAQVDASWLEPYRMAMRVAALAQTIDATLDVQDQAIRVELRLPMLLSFMADSIAGAIQKRGGELLLSDDRPKT